MFCAWRQEGGALRSADDQTLSRRRPELGKAKRDDDGARAHLMRSEPASLRAAQLTEVGIWWVLVGRLGLLSLSGVTVVMGENEQGKGGDRTVSSTRFHSPPDPEIIFGPDQPIRQLDSPRTLADTLNSTLAMMVVVSGEVRLTGFG